MAPIIPSQHHHRSTTKVSHKPFKSRHSTKGALKERAKGKLASDDKVGRRTQSQMIQSKLDRRNQAKQKRLANHSENVKVTNIFSGRDGAPRVVAIIPLCDDVSAAEAVRNLSKSLDIEQSIPEKGWAKVDIERFKQKIQFILGRRELLPALDAARMADFVLFVLSAEREVDALGELLLKTIESQGVSNCFAAVQGLESINPSKRRVQIVSSLKSFITHFLPTTEKIYSLDARQECANLGRSLCTTTPRGIRWREDRSWMMVEDIRWPSSKAAMVDSQESTGIILTGVVRGRPLKADRLVQLGDWGDFQVEKITAAPINSRKRDQAESMSVDDNTTEEILDEASEDRDDLNELAPEEVVMEDVDDYAVSIAPSERKGVLLDDHHYFSEEEEMEAPKRPKRLPRGTSNYQAAWYIDDVSDSGSDLEDADEEEDEEGREGFGAGPSHPADGMEDVDYSMKDPTEAALSEYPQSEMFLDHSPEEEAEELAEYRKSRRTEAEEDLEFPDEIELHPNVLARERLSKYRGLKSLRTSAWETEEDKPYEPSEWRRLLQIRNYPAAKHKVMQETIVGGVKAGTRVHVHIKGVPLSIQQTYEHSKPLALFSLLRHEHKRTAVNYSISLNSDCPSPVKAKEELIAQCGPRRFIINPLFSQQGVTPNDVHKFDRYLHPGRNAVASFTGPLTWGSVPVLYFKRDTNLNSDLETSSSVSPLSLVATGTSLPPSLSRVIAKRIILTGHPYKIHKKVVTVRYMFFNKEDVAWFKALQLWTKRGRSGFIKESLGTHGYFKANFDGKINPMDAVAVSLYKRAWPRSAKVWKQE